MTHTSPTKSMNAHLLSAAYIAVAILIAYIANIEAPQTFNASYPNTTGTVHGLLSFLAFLGAGAGLLLLMGSFMNGSFKYRVTVVAVCLLATIPLSLFNDTGSPYFVGVALAVYMLAGIYGPPVSIAISRRYLT